MHATIIHKSFKIMITTYHSLYSCPSTKQQLPNAADRTAGAVRRYSVSGIRLSGSGRDNRKPLVQGTAEAEAHRRQKGECVGS